MVIRLSCTQLLLAFAFIGVSYARNGSAQINLNRRIDLSANNSSIESVLKKLEKVTNARFVYSNNMVNVRKKVSVNANGERLDSLLDNMLRDNGIVYEVINDRIVLSRFRGGSDIPPAARTDRNVPPVSTYQVTVTGKVTGDDGAPLVGVTVQVKGSNIGAVTDVQGRYTIQPLSGRDTLVFSYIGYVTREVPIEDRTNIDVPLQASASGLNEVVVVGYGTQKRSDLTGSITTLKASDLTAGGTVSNVAQALQGHASGVTVTQNSSAPGGSISIRIRGSNSISSSNEPLYVIDGFPTTEGLNINPSDIASIDILKDASATAIYGSRGANGVIVITTKRGKAGINQISYNGYTGVQKLINPFHLLNGKQYMELANALYKEIPGQENMNNGVYTASQLQSDVNTDWIDVSTRSGVVQNHELQFSGGNDKTKVLTSIGYFDQKGILKNTEYNRISGRINVDQQINDYIKSGASLLVQRGAGNYQLYDGNILNSNVIYSLLNYDPTVLPYNADGTFGRPPGGRGDNPLANLLARENDMQNDKFNGSLYLEISPLEGLTARVDGGAEITHDRQGQYLPKSTYQGSIDNGDASLNRYASSHQLFDAFITYHRLFGEVHDFSIMGGYSYEKFTNEAQGASVYGFSTDAFSYNNLGAAATISGVSSVKSENLLISFFSRLNYTYNNKYLFTFTLRRDGSSRFGADHRWGIFPSGSFAWRLSEEPFMKNWGIFEDAKVRASYGKTGNERIGDYSSLALVSPTHVTFDGVSNTTGTHLNQSTPENTRLKWESTAQYDVGLDLSILQGRLSGSLDAYYKKTSDLLININFPLYSGFISGQSNVGSVENKGFEFNINSRNLTGKLKWETGLNFSLNRNKVLDLGSSDDIMLTSAKPLGTVSEESFAIIRVGEPLGSIFGYVYDGVIQPNEKYGPEPLAKPGDPKFKDISGPEGTPDGVINNFDRTILGNAYPKFIYGITNTFSYAHFDLSVFAYGSQGNHLLNMTRMLLEWNRSTDALNRWTPTNTNTDQPRNGFFYSTYGGYINSHFVENASFFRLKNVTLGYTVPVPDRILHTLRVYVSCENLFTISPYSGWNPEVNTKAYENDPRIKHGGSSQTANAGAGLDFNSYPSMRTYTLGLNVTF